jgi:hypothetical protein
MRSLDSEVRARLSSDALAWVLENNEPSPIGGLGPKPVLVIGQNQRHLDASSSMSNSFK